MEVESQFFVPLPIAHREAPIPPRHPRIPKASGPPHKKASHRTSHQTVTEEVWTSLALEPLYILRCIGRSERSSFIVPSVAREVRPYQ